MIILIKVFNQIYILKGVFMPKGYFLSAHRSPANPEKRNAYLALAAPAIEKSKIRAPQIIIGTARSPSGM